MRLQELLEGVDVVSVRGNGEIEIAGIASDSREVGPGYLFAALRGEKLDGHEFIGSAVSAGAVAVLSGRPAPSGAAVTWVHAAGARAALAVVAKRWFGAPDEGLVLVGVTGTNGKTSVTYILHAILGNRLGPAGRIGTISYDTVSRETPAMLTTPEAISIQRMLGDMREAGCRSAVMEVSSHAIDRERVRGLDFDLLVFTNLTRDHLDYHGDMESYYQVKKRLFSCGWRKRPVAVVNIDNKWGRRLKDEIDLETVTFGSSEAADVHPLSVESGLEGIRMEVVVPGGNLALRSRLIGAPNVQNILASLAAAHGLGFDVEEAAAAVGEVPTVRGRLERVPTGQPFEVIVDYAHTDDALRTLLVTARELLGEQGGRIITVFGCGGDRDRGKRPLMGRHAVRLSDVAILTSDNPRSEEPMAIIRDVEKGIEQVPEPRAEYHLIPERREAIRAAVSMAAPGDLVLIAGKGHEDYQIIGDKRLPFDDRQVVQEGVEDI